MNGMKENLCRESHIVLQMPEMSLLQHLMVSLGY